jgi:hypothetical protein
VLEGWQMIAKIVEQAKALVAKFMERVNKLREKK